MRYINAEKLEDDLYTQSGAWTEYRSVFEEFIDEQPTIEGTEAYVVVTDDNNYWCGQGATWSKNIRKAVMYKNVKTTRETLERFKHLNPHIRRIRIIEEDVMHEENL